MATRLLSSACPLRLRPLVRRHPAPQHCRTPQRQALARHVGLALMDVARVTLVLLSRHASKAVDVPAEQVGVVTVPMCVNFDGLQDVLKYANTVSPSPPLLLHHHYHRRRRRRRISGGWALLTARGTIVRIVVRYCTRTPRASSRSICKWRWLAASKAAASWHAPCRPASRSRAPSRWSRISLAGE